MKNPFKERNNQNGCITGIEMMGDNLRDTLAYVGKDVVLYPLCKMIRSENAYIDDYSRILDNVFIDAGKQLKIGKHSMITWNVIIEGGAKTTIGDRVFIGPGTCVLTSTYQVHGLYSAEFIPNGTHNIMYGDIVFEDDSYVGANCTILPGVRIGEGAVVGAGCVVNKDLEPWGIYVGLPCRRIGSREKPSKEVTYELMKDVDWSKHF